MGTVNVVGQLQLLYKAVRFYEDQLFEEGKKITLTPVLDDLGIRVTAVTMHKGDKFRKDGTVSWSVIMQGNSHLFKEIVETLARHIQTATKLADNKKG